MRPFVTAVLVLACLLGSNIPLAWRPLAYADEGYSGSGPMRAQPLPEMMRNGEGPRPWFHGRGGHRGRLVSAMLHSKDELGLTPEQIRTLKEVRADFQRGTITRTAEIKLAAVDLRGLMEQDTLNLPKVEAQVRKIASLHADQRVAGIKMVQAGKAVLTPEQREKFQLLAHAPRMGRWGMGRMSTGGGRNDGARLTPRSGRLNDHQPRRMQASCAHVGVDYTSTMWTLRRAE